MKKRTFLKMLSALPIMGLLPKAFAYISPKQGYTLVYPKGAPKTCKELVEWMEKTLPVGTPTNISYSVTGEDYKEFAIGVLTKTFEKSVYYSKKYKNKEALLCSIQWRTFLKECLKCEGEPVLYWRMKPEYSEWSTEDTYSYIEGRVIRTKSVPVRERSKIYMRYLVSDKLVTFSSQLRHTQRMMEARILTFKKPRAML